MMFASGYVPGQIASLLGESKTKQENTKLATLFESPQSRKKKKRASGCIAAGEDIKEGTAGKKSKSVPSQSGATQISDDTQRKKKKKKKSCSNGETDHVLSEDLQDVTPKKKRKNKSGQSPTEIQAPNGVSAKGTSPKKKKKLREKNAKSSNDVTLQQKSENLSEDAESLPDEDLTTIGLSGVGDGETLENEEVVPKKSKKKLPADPDTTVFVGNLPTSTDKKMLKKIFKKYGKIVSIRFRSAAPADPKVPKKVAAIKKEFHESRNNINAYVVFDNKEQAQSATKANGVVVNKFTIRVDLVEGAKKHDHIRSVFVGNLPFNIEEEPLREHFADCGDIENVRVIRDSKSGLGKGFGFILFKEKQGASFATHLNGKVFQGRSLRIQRSVEPEKPKEKSKKTTEISQKKKKKRHGLHMPTNASSKDYEGIHAQKVQKMKQKQKFKKKHKKLAQMEELAKKHSKTFNQPPKGKNRGENARFRLSLREKQKKKNKS